MKIRFFIRNLFSRIVEVLTIFHRNPTTNQSDFQNTERTNTRTTQYQPTATTAHLTETNQTTPNPEIMQQVDIF